MINRGLYSLFISSKSSIFFQSKHSQKVTLPKLDYRYEELEPFPSKQLVTNHITKYHQNLNYVDVYNNLMEELAEPQSKIDIKYFLYLLELNLAWADTLILSFIIHWKNLCL